MAPGVPAASPDPAATLQYIIPAAPMPQVPVVVPQKLGN
jgi:hypothetical protein